jgi:cytochrome c oxidase subunit 4
MMDARVDAKHYVFVWLALVLLAAASLGLSFLHLGAFSVAVAFAIAVAKAALVVLIFMHIGRMQSSVRVVGFVCVVLFLLLLTLMAADVVTRATPPMLPTR